MNRDALKPNGAPALPPVPEGWCEQPAQVHDIKVSAPRGLVQVTGRERFGLRDVTIELPLSAVLRISGEFLVANNGGRTVPS